MKKVSDTFLVGQGAWVVWVWWRRPRGVGLCFAIVWVNSGVAAGILNGVERLDGLPDGFTR